MTKVTQYHEQNDLPLEDSQIEALVKEVLSFKRIECDEIIFHFVSVERITDLHGEFFDDPTPTDCMTFPIDSPDSEGEVILGEVFVCPKVATHYLPENPYHETTLYIVHGILHLLHYDDIEEHDRKEMRTQESALMEYLEQKKLVLTSKKVSDKSRE